MARRIWACWAIVLIWSTIMWILFSLPEKHIPDVELNLPFLSHAVHFGLFFIFAWLFYRAVRTTWAGLSFGWTFILVACAALLFGVTNELNQSFVPGRHPSFWDVLTNNAGALFFMFLVRRKQDRQKSPSA